MREANPNRKLNSSELHTGFFTREASDDFEYMLRGIVDMCEFYATEITFVAKRITSDILENGFAAIKMDVGHNRMTAQAATQTSCNIEATRQLRSANALNEAGVNRKTNCEPDAEETFSYLAPVDYIKEYKAEKKEALIINKANWR